MNKFYKPFDNVEDLWFWFCACVEARGDGLRSRGDYPGEQREVELGDIYRIIKRMKLSHQITNRELRIMSRWGLEGSSPHHDRRAKQSEIRLWERGICALEAELKNKRIIS